jgi:uncharacterized repeat protein (TIGR01451 family)
MQHFVQNNYQIYKANNYNRMFRFLLIIALVFTRLSITAQVIRPYNLLYSENLKGGSTLFGNTMMHIIDDGTVNLIKMNETGDPANPAGGIGFSQYGNDNANMQFADVDGTLPPTTDVFAFGSSWKYLDNNTRPANWETVSFNDAAWAQGNGQFGFGDSDEGTVINGGPASSRYMSTYFRKTITVPAGLYRDYTLNLVYDDGAIIYLNGVELWRVNMPAGAIVQNTPALSAEENATATLSIPASALLNGNNVFAVEVHQRSNKSDDLSFDLSLTGTNINTLNSSSAQLILPPGTNTVRFARLYWGGRINNSVLAAAPDTLRTVKIRKGTTGPYVTIVAPATYTDQSAATSTATNYQSYIDVTTFVNANGPGIYTVADIPASAGAVASGGHYAGWGIVVAYENLTQPFNSIRIYDGFLNVFNGGAAVSQSVTLTGLNVPNTPLTLGDAVMTSMIWEGDANLGATASNPAGDFLKINGTAFFNTVNPVTNMWNGSISKNGSFVTTKDPNYTNQLGIDIDEIQVGAGFGILPNATSVNIEFGTEADRYFPSLFCFTIRMKEPAININKTVVDANGNGIVEANEQLTYTLSGQNTGQGTAFNCTVTDTLPGNLTYVPGTMEVVNCPGLTPGFKTDQADGDIAEKGVTPAGRDWLRFFLGNLATGTSGGNLQPGESYTLRFKVQASAIPGSVINTARIRANSVSGEPFVDDGTAIMSPLGGSIPVVLSRFTASLFNDQTATLQWITQQEQQFSHFIVERSTDAQQFSARARVNGAGNSNTERRYAIQDVLDPAVKIYYYRLCMVDADGKKAYSSIIALRKGVLNATLFPNPVHHQCTLQYNSDRAQTLHCRFIAGNGQVVLERRISIQNGMQLIVLNNLETLPAGQYVLSVWGNGEDISFPVVKR